MPEVLKFLIGTIILILIILYYVFIILPVRAEIAQGEREKKEDRKLAEFFAQTSFKGENNVNEYAGTEEHYPDSNF